jgi:hypothetical protein
MTELQKLAGMNDVATGAAVGGGVGAAGGLLATLLQKKPSLKKGLKNMLIGSTSGAAIGGGTMAVKQIAEGNKQPEGEKAPEPKPEAPAPKKEPKSMDMASSAKHGLLPIAGPAIQGHKAGGGLQALLSGGSSAAGMGAGAVAGIALEDLLKAKGKTPAQSLIPAILALTGSVGGSMGAAHMFNEREKAAGAEDIGRAIDQAAGNLGGASVKPFSNTGGAAMGGAAGAALGGGAGLLKALFDSEDDGIVSTLGKALSGGALGGLAGAGLGAGASHLARNNVLKASPLVQKMNARGKHVADQSLRRLTVPGKSIADLIRDGNPDRFRKDVGNANTRESVLHALAPMVASSADLQPRSK